MPTTSTDDFLGDDELFTSEQLSLLGQHQKVFQMVRKVGMKGLDKAGRNRVATHFCDVANAECPKEDRFENKVMVVRTIMNKGGYRQRQSRFNKVCGGVCTCGVPIIVPRTKEKTCCTDNETTLFVGCC